MGLKLQRIGTKLSVKLARTFTPAKFSGQHICHFSFHKNLTVYYKKVARDLAFETGRQKHFNSYKDEFLEAGDLDMRSVNNHFVDTLDLNTDTKNQRSSLFVRDPRDLVVSGYHYHKRGAEWWCNVKNPTPDTLKTVNLSLPAKYLQQDESISECLSRLDEETGLQMEIDMRAPHFNALEQWMGHLEKDASLLMLTYDEMFEDNVAGMTKLADHYLLNDFEKEIWISNAQKYARQNVKTAHIRDPSTAQWKKMFAPAHNAYFAQNYAGLMAAIDRL